MARTPYCPECGKEAPLEGAAFCPFCGAELGRAAASEAVRAALKKAGEQSDPIKKRELLLAALGEHPDSLELEEELLHLGSLHERSSRKLDFSVIKCYLLHIYRAPEELAEGKRDEMRRELFHDPRLARCLGLAPDADAFMLRYLTRLAGEYIDIFLRGDNRVMRTFMGFRLDGRAAKLVAPYVADMIGRVSEDGGIDARERELLRLALRAAYVRFAGGDARCLDEGLKGRCRLGR